MMTLTELLGVLVELDLVELWNNIVDHVSQKFFNRDDFVQFEAVLSLVWQDFN